MKKYLSKAEKRELKKQDRGFIEILEVVHHFFKDFMKWVDEITDPRNKSYITYTQNDLIVLGLIKNICSIDSMRQMEEKFN